jgi:chromosome segregation ATPase
MAMPEMDEMDEMDEIPETGEGDMEGIEMDEPAMELSESDLKALLEELEFDYEPKPSGWAAGLNKPTAEMEENIELLAAIEEFKAENEKVKKENDNLKESIELFEKMMTDYKIRTKKYVKIAKQLENKLNEVNLTNARLLYTNRALNSSSLNERQKKSIVESISKAQTIEEAKIIYETLENAVGSSYNKRRPKSLSEAVSRNSSPFYPRRQERNDRDSAFADRMKLLAGIKK